jgi:(p)ppGpp synthase/HD superfamily hydrolase
MIKTRKYWYWYWKFRYYIAKDKKWYKRQYPDSKNDVLYDAMLWALETHHKVNQTYDGYPYFFHLNEVSKIAIMFKHLVANNASTFIGALLHDVIEDARLTYNDVEKLWGKEVADIVFACTEIRGRNRRERHGPFYFRTLRENKLGCFVKVCDVIANMERGLKTGSGMIHKYVKEYPHFKSELYTEEFKTMFMYIEEVILSTYKEKYPNGK